MIYDDQVVVGQFVFVGCQFLINDVNNEEIIISF